MLAGVFDIEFPYTARKEPAMTVPVAAIIARLKDLNIMPILKDGNLILKAKPGAITERCKAVVRENKAAIIEYLTKASCVPFEEQIGALFKGGCNITMQPKGLSLSQHLSQLHNSETRVSTKEKRPTWTDDQWRESEEIQFEKVREYRERWLTDPVDIEESYMDTEGFMVIPSFRRLKRI